MEHSLLEGDNLIGLQWLMPTYEGRVDIIYIDPPYNTGHKALAYNDRHADWAAMMQPRLELGRKLLNEQGVMVISIDQHELFRLGTLCNEIFGEENCLGVVTVVNNLKGRSDGRHFATCNEFMLFYARNASKVHLNLTDIDEEEADAGYPFHDEQGCYKPIGLRKTGKEWKRESRPLMYYPILQREGEFFSISDEEYAQIYHDGIFDDDYVDRLCEHYRAAGYNIFLPIDRKERKGRWRWGFNETFQRCFKTELCVNQVGTLCAKMRARLEDGSLRGKMAKTTWYKAEYDTGVANKQLEKILGNRRFDSPKAVEHIKDVLRLFNKDAIVVDFFAGSGTTLHAALELNHEDGGHRKCLLITDNENNICREVTLERCRRIIEGYRTADGQQVDGFSDNTLNYQVLPL
jgi:adenine-specific DNA-methyltransferase